MSSRFPTSLNNLNNSCEKSRRMPKYSQELLGITGLLEESLVVSKNPNRFDNKVGSDRKNGESFALGKVSGQAHTLHTLHTGTHSRDKVIPMLTHWHTYTPGNKSPVNTNRAPSLLPFNHLTIHRHFFKRFFQILWDSSQYFFNPPHSYPEVKICINETPINQQHVSMR